MKEATTPSTKRSLKWIPLALSLSLVLMSTQSAHAFDIRGAIDKAKDVKEVAEAFSINDKKEVELGNEMHPYVLQEMGGAYSNKAANQYVNNVGQKLVKTTSRKNIPYTFTVVNADYANAFAIPGGHVYVTRGLLRMMKDESELSAVLGHEIGHVTEKHGIKRLQEEVITQKGAKYSGKLGGAIAQKLASTFAKLASSGYGRGQELEADRVGVHYSNDAGYDPEGAVRLFKHLKELEKSGSKSSNPLGKFFASHPDTDKRIKQAEKEISGLNKKGKATNAAQYKAALKNI